MITVTMYSILDCEIYICIPYSISSIYWKFCQNIINMLSLWTTTICFVRSSFRMLTLLSNLRRRSRIRQYPGHQWSAVSSVLCPASHYTSSPTIWTYDRTCLWTWHPPSTRPTILWNILFSVFFNNSSRCGVSY